MRLEMVGSPGPARESLPKCGGWVVGNAQESRWCQTRPLPERSADTHFLLKKEIKQVSFLVCTVC